MNRKWIGHTDNCRLRMYLAYKDNDHMKYRNIRHLFEPEFDQKEVDKEGAKVVPPSTPGRMVFENSQPSDRSKEGNRIGENDELTPAEIEAAMNDDPDTNKFYDEVNADINMEKPES